MMTIMRFALVVLMLAVARDADACQCMESGPPCQSFFEAQAVFVGTVRSITPVERTSMGPDNVRVEFEEVIAFRGVEGSTQTAMTSEVGLGSCAYPFKVGQRYVVYASRGRPDRPLLTSTCSRTRPIADAAEDLQFFKSLSNATGSPRVFGSVTQSEPGTMFRDGRSYGALANVRLTLQSDTASFNATTDAQGRYELTNLPPATYHLSVEPPPELMSHDTMKRPITLSDSHSCAERNFVMHFDGRVRGSLRNSTGGPAAGVLVQLMRIEYIDSSGLINTIDATTDDAGRFEFSGITPARYVLGVDLFRQPHLQSASGAVFGATYHPGTPEALRATIVDIRGGERHDLTPMTLPPPLRAHRLTGIVRFEDGTPAAGATALLGDPVKKWLDVAEPVDVDASGTFSFIVHEGLSYLVSAYYRPPNAGRMPLAHTDVGPFRVTKPPAPLEIRVARAPQLTPRRWGADGALVYVGAYTRTLGKGIYGFRFQRATGAMTPLGLMAETPHASFIAPHPGGNFLYATIEHEGDDPPGVDNAISAYRVNPATGSLTFLNRVSSRGEGPNHISIDRTGQTLLVSNYRNGTVAALPILDDGRLGDAASVVKHSGSSVHPVRQLGPHPHFVLTSPDNRFVLVPDLGTDRIVVYRFDAQRRTLTPNVPPFATVRPGSQPRHLAFHPSAKFVYVNGEASSDITAFAYDAQTGSLREFQTISTLPADFAGTSTTAEVQVDPAGRFLYVSNRGHDSITIFSIDQATGRLTSIDHVPTNGQTPRHFTFDPAGRFLLVGNQNSHTVVVYRVDATSGTLTPIQTIADVPEPACLAFVY